jgi:CubicO group peptidase (beta-lactamase class C family)
LATHTSGLPRLPANLTLSVCKNPQNPYAAYTSADLLTYLATYKPKQRRKPASTPALKYSNLGYGLLGHVVAQKIGTSYEKAVVSRICDPLGMGDTCIHLSLEQYARLATPHTARGKPTSHWDIPTLAGAGALRSTACDMLKFIDTNLGNAPESLQNVLQTCHTVQVEIPPPRGLRGLTARWRRRRLSNCTPPVSMALGWLISLLKPSGHKVYWHNGATGGFCAFVGFVNESNTGVVVLSNKSPSQYGLSWCGPSVEEIGLHVLQCLQ